MIWLKRITMILAGILVIAGAVFAVTRQSNLFKVREIPVVVTDAISEDGFHADPATVADLQQRMKAKLKPFVKLKIWEIKIRDVQAAVKDDPWVKGIRISRSFPNHVEVEVSPRAAVFLISTGKGQLLPVSADNEIVEMMNPAAIPDVPVLKGEQFIKDRNIRSRALEFARQLPQNGTLSLQNISELTFANDTGFSAQLLSTRATIIFGEGKIEQKVARIEQILDYLTAHQLKERIIDASYSKKVLVRLRQGP